MRAIILVFLVSACTAYPKVHWPNGSAPAGSTPPLLPQSEVMDGTATEDTGPALTARAEELRAWAKDAGK